MTITIVFLFALTHPFSYSQDINSDYLSKYLNLLKLIQTKQFNKAILEGKKIIEEDYTFYLAYEVLVQASQKTNTLDELIGYFLNLVKENPSNLYAYYGIGLAYKEKNDYPKAVKSFKKCIELGAEFSEVYKELAYCYQKKEELTNIINYLKKLIKLEPENPYLYFGLGYGYLNLSEYHQARKYLEQALALFKKIANRKEVGKCLRQIGRVYWFFNNLFKALEYCEQALIIAEEIKDKEEEGIILNNIGNIYWMLGNYPKALKYFEQALIIAEKIGDKNLREKNIRTVGNVYWSLGNYPKALEYYKQALILAQEIKDKAEEGKCLVAIAVIYWHLGNYSKSFEYYNHGLTVSKEMEDKRNEGLILRNIGLIYSSQGDYLKALEYYEQSLDIARESKYKWLQISCLNSIGIFYSRLGDYEKALKNYYKGLEIARGIRDKRDEAIYLDNIGYIYRKKNDYNKALAYYQSGLRISQGIGDKRGVGYFFRNIGSIYFESRDYNKALKYYNQSLNIAEQIGDEELKGRNSIQIGDIFLKLNNYSQSLTYYNQALKKGFKIGAPEIIWHANFGLASVYEKQGKPFQAIGYYKKAITEVENIRAQLQLSEYKSGFLKDKIEIYASLISLLVKMHNQDPLRGYNKESFYFAERAKARAFLDSLQEAKIDITDFLSTELRKEQIQINKKISLLLTELQKSNLSEENRRELFKELEDSEDEYQSLIRKIRKKNPQYAHLVYPEPYRFEEVQYFLLNKIKNDLILEYFLGEDKSFLWIITKKKFFVHQLPGREKLEEMVIEFRNLIVQPDSSLSRIELLGRKLYQILVEPAEEELKNKNNLIIIPDGILYYLPFETLIQETGSRKQEAGKEKFQIQNSKSQRKLKFRFLVEDYNISYASSATSLAYIINSMRTRARKPRYQLLAFGDPIYPTSPKKLVSAQIYENWYSQFKRLPFTKEEVSGVGLYFPEKSKKIFEQNLAKEEILKGLNLDDFKIIHFATHSLIDEEFPSRSAVILTLDNDPTEDGFLQLREIYNLKLNADLVVLSACQTSLGKFIRGEGIVGLTRGFIYAGAPSIISSLWNVGDRSTADLMKLFYFYLKRGENKGSALRKAKLNIMKLDLYRHPYHWAGLILTGESNSVVFTNQFKLIFLILLFLIVMTIFLLFIKLFQKFIL
ncbi:MAG: tetratricopeptide repeat protein [Candidatus Aminicenantia bacterium]